METQNNDTTTKVRFDLWLVLAFLLLLGAIVAGHIITVQADDREKQAETCAMLNETIVRTAVLEEQFKSIDYSLKLLVQAAAIKK
jgi:hypothetical protein